MKRPKRKKNSKKKQPKNNKPNRKQNRRRGNSGYANSGNSPTPNGKKDSNYVGPIRKKQRSMPPYRKRRKSPSIGLIISAIEAGNMDYLDRPLYVDKDGNEVNLGDTIPDPKNQAFGTWANALLGSVAQNQYQEDIVKLALEEYTKTEITKLLGKKSQSTITEVFQRIRGYMLAGASVETMLKNKMKGLSLFEHLL